MSAQDGLLRKREYIELILERLPLDDTDKQMLWCELDYMPRLGLRILLRGLEDMDVSQRPRNLVIETQGELT